MLQPPSGTVTFLFTDIEGSTKLWESDPDAMRGALACHDEIVRASIEANGGYVFKTMGDAFCAAFHTAPEAVAAALDAQQSLLAERWQIDPPVRARMALHAGAADERDGDYFGQPLNRVARLLAAGQGGQTLLSAAAQELIRDQLPTGCALIDLGEASLKDLARPERVFQLNHPTLPSDFAPLKTLNSAALPNNLPQQLTSFIGRETELAAVKTLLLEWSLLTLVGAGGAGKTRLALQAAADLLDGEGDGVWLVELAPIIDPALVPGAVAQAMGVNEVAGETISRTLVDALKSKTLLLVLDNCEHVLGACGSLVTDILKSCPGVSVLATSREPLGVPGERIYRVPSLSLPSNSANEKHTAESLTLYEAVRLFIDRAKTVQPSFTVTDQNAPAVAQVCYELDGIPLAIELAAARLRSMDIEQVNSRLTQRFRLLTGGSRYVLPRQQTLRALIDWSYDLLSEQEKALFECLSIFVGGWSLEAAEIVCAGFNGIDEQDIVDLLASLTDKSLIVFEEGGLSLANGRRQQARYHMLSTIRQYGRERLADGSDGISAAELRHRDWCLTLARQAEPEMKGPDAESWLAILDAEHDNLVAAVLACEIDPTPAGIAAGLQLCSMLWRFWSIRGYFSLGRERLDIALQRAEGVAGLDAPATLSARAKALNGAGALAYLQSDYAPAEPYFEASLQISRQLEDEKSIAALTLNLGNLADVQGDTAKARMLWQDSLDIRRKLGDKSGIAASLGNLGAGAIDQGDYAAALSLLQESLAIRRELKDEAGIAETLQHLGFLAYVQNDYPAAAVHHRQSLEIRRRLGQSYAIGISLDELGATLQAQGDIAAAEALYRESLDIYRQIGMHSAVALALNNLGGTALERNDLTQAHALLAEALEISRQMDNLRTLSISQLNLASVAIAEGDGAGARGLLKECMPVRRAMEDHLHIALILAAFAEVEALTRNLERSILLWGAAAATMERIGSALPSAEKSRQEFKIAQARAALPGGTEAFDALWAKGHDMPQDQAIEYALSR